MSRAGVSAFPMLLPHASPAHRPPQLPYGGWSFERLGLTSPLMQLSAGVMPLTTAGPLTAGFPVSHLPGSSGMYASCSSMRMADQAPSRTTAGPAGQAQRPSGEDPTSCKAAPRCPVRLGQSLSSAFSSYATPPVDKQSIAVVKPAASTRTGSTTTAALSSDLTSSDGTASSGGAGLCRDAWPAAGPDSPCARPQHAAAPAAATAPLERCSSAVSPPFAPPPLAAGFPPLPFSPALAASLPVGPEALERMMLGSAYTASAAADHHHHQNAQLLLLAQQEPRAAASARRAEAVARYLKKRKERSFEKRVRYESRQKLAESRPRIRGQFVKAADLAAYRAGAALAEASREQQQQQQPASAEESGGSAPAAADSADK